ncbi:MAG: RNA polymerase sigma factor [Candidatus Blackburnbacteria bacterium]|nr:RNA polymerase sigma factor [Candidatus Blackburnbacteria bacterium]
MAIALCERKNGLSPPPPTEHELVRRAQAGDNTAFATLFEVYQTPILKYICRFTDDREAARDLTQDTFLKAYLGIQEMGNILLFRQWLYRIATNTCISRWRHESRASWEPWEDFLATFHPCQVAKDSPEQDFINKENAEEVMHILSQLKPKYRACLLLREYHDLSYDEIAEVLKITESQVKTWLFRAREKFKQVWTNTERKPYGNLVRTRDGRRGGGNARNRNNRLTLQKLRRTSPFTGKQ